MTFKRYTYTGADMLQESLNHPYYLASDNQGLQYVPSTPYDPLITEEGEAYHTHQPLEGPNVSWEHVKYNWTRGTNTSPAVFENVVSLWGITEDHNVELIGEHITTTCSSPATTPTTEIGVFDLSNHSSQATIIKTTPLTSNGKVRVNLPFRWQYYEDMVLDCYTNFDDVTPTYTVTMATTPGVDDLYITYTTPVGWSDGLYCTVRYNEYGKLETSPPPIATNAKNTLSLGYDGLDKYNALRLKIETTANYAYNVNYTWFEYGYNVII